MAEQCRGITKSGQQCKITGIFDNGYCFRHKDQADGEALVETVVIAPRQKAPAKPVVATPPPKADPVFVAAAASSTDAASPVEDCITYQPENSSGSIVPIIIGALAFIFAVLLFSRRPRG